MSDSKSPTLRKAASWPTQRGFQTAISLFPLFVESDGGIFGLSVWGSFGQGGNQQIPSPTDNFSNILSDRNLIESSKKLRFWRAVYQIQLVCE